jgi:hypothetical protein
MATKKTTPKKSAFDYRTITSVEAAFTKCGIDPSLRPDISMLPERFGFLMTCFILSVIFEAVNDGWVPDFSNHQQGKYYPWPWVSSSGLGFAGSTYLYGRAFTDVGSRLCTDKSEKAIFILEQFPDLWKHWLLNVKPQ